MSTRNKQFCFIFCFSFEKLISYFVFASLPSNLGASRGFAFVEFNTEVEAIRWMEFKQVSLYLAQVIKKNNFFD